MAGSLNPFLCANIPNWNEDFSGDKKVVSFLVNDARITSA